MRERRSRHYPNVWAATAVALSLLLSLAAPPAVAHGLQLFAAAQGSQIAGTVRMAGGIAAGTRILILDTSGEHLAEITPMEDGSFSYQAREPMDHLIVADSGDGHRATRRISTSELAAGFPRWKAGHSHDGPRPDAGETPRSAEPRLQIAPIIASEKDPLQHHAHAQMLEPELEAAIGLAVARQIVPLRQELEAERERLRFQDILGGFGYIAGLAGFALWWQNRRSGRSD